MSQQKIANVQGIIMNCSVFTSMLMTTLVLPYSLYGYTLETMLTKESDKQQTIALNFKLDKDELLYKNSVQATVNNPAVRLTIPVANKEAVTEFDKATQENKEGYKDAVQFSLQAEKKTEKPVTDANVHVSFLINTAHEPQEKLVTLSFDPKKAIQQPDSSVEQQAINQRSTADTNCYPEQPSVTSSLIRNGLEYVTGTLRAWRASLSSLFESTGSIWLRLLVAFILGILLSLTPCIYPMIPITVGILQTGEQRSVFRNFLGALAYTFGISCTFAALGFITALTSCVFGELQTKTWIVLPFVALLAYLGFAMFGLYELYIPKFLRPKATTVKGGSLLSAFVFGAISGTVASPCLSPGLALILAYVAKITKHGSLINYFDGFSTLFVFGIGSSLPLLIIGTFSSSLAILPRAGLWMVEIKRILGLMLLATAFYQLKYFVPWHVLVWFIIPFLFAVGVYYLMDIKPYDSTGIRRYKNSVGVIFIIASCLMLIQGFKAVYHVKEVPSPFLTLDYSAAVQKAQQEHKKLLLAFKTKYCAACTALDNRVFSDKRVQEVLKHYVPIKIDATQAHEEPFATLKTTFDIKGFPTIVLQDPETGAALKKWVGDVGSTSEFLQELESDK